MNKRMWVLPLLVGLALAGCGSADEETVAPKVPARGTAAKDGAFSDPRRDPLGAVPVTVSANALAVGNQLGSDGNVVARASSFAIGDTVHVAFPTAGRQPGAPVTVFWTYQDGRTHHEERGALQSTPFAHYEFDRQKGMQPGKYNVEVQIANRPIGISDFVVQ
ncbi:hypothetical protein [Lysobacter xanthus]